MGEHELAGLLLALAGLAGGLAGPALIRRIPEPVPDPDADPAPGPEGDPPPVKELYADIAALPHLAAGLAGVAALAGLVVGFRIGLDPVLVPWAYVLPLGVVLGLVDWRTRLLPTWVIAPSYAVVAALTGLAALLAADARVLLHGAVGWALMGGIYLLLWLIYPQGMGYGDVRLSGVLGIALGVLGVPEVVVGAWFGFLLGGVGGVLLARLGSTGRRNYPQGPFMVAGAVLGVVLGPALIRGLGY